MSTALAKEDCGRFSTIPQLTEEPAHLTPGIPHPPDTSTDASCSNVSHQGHVTVNNPFRIQLLYSPGPGPQISLPYGWTSAAMGTQEAVRIREQRYQEGWEQLLTRLS